MKRRDILRGEDLPPTLGVFGKTVIKPPWTDCGRKK